MIALRALSAKLELILRHGVDPSHFQPQDYDNASAVLSKAAKLMADTDGRAACDLFIAAMDIMKV